MNVSHIIHDLSFGPKYPGLHNPLDDTVRVLQGTSGTFKYYIKVNAMLYLTKLFYKYPMFVYVQFRSGTSTSSIDLCLLVAPNLNECYLKS